MLLDTNIVIYACQPAGEWLAPWTENPAAAIASVSRVEALGFPGISGEEDAVLRQLIGASVCYNLDDEVIERAIGLRRIKRMGTADAIIAATALEFGLPLVTRNVDDFKHIAGLEIINPFAEPETA
jgi:predicted nucleic acid-binding protein